MIRSSFFYALAHLQLISIYAMVIEEQGGMNKRKRKEKKSDF